MSSNVTGPSSSKSRSDTRWVSFKGLSRDGQVTVADWLKEMTRSQTSLYPSRSEDGLIGIADGPHISFDGDQGPNRPLSRLSTDEFRDRIRSKPPQPIGIIHVTSILPKSINPPDSSGQSSATIAPFGQTIVVWPTGRGGTRVSQYESLSLHKYSPDQRNPNDKVELSGYIVQQPSSADSDYWLVEATGPHSPSYKFQSYNAFIDTGTAQDGQRRLYCSRFDLKPPTPPPTPSESEYYPSAASSLAPPPMPMPTRHPSWARSAGGPQMSEADWRALDKKREKGYLR